VDGIAPNVDLLARLLSAAELRHKVLAANLANADTPGYVRRDVRFEDLLRDALQRGSTRAQDLEPQVVLDTASPARRDGNNVALESELNALRENRLLYETYATMLSGHFELLRTAITEGR
jgi:flagellar basal-body rod protein FlgB